jgi:hypothetical protein
MKVAKARGRLRCKQPKLKPNQAKHLLELHDSGNRYGAVRQSKQVAPNYIRGCYVNYRLLKRRQFMHDKFQAKALNGCKCAIS